MGGFGYDDDCDGYQEMREKSYDDDCDGEIK